MSDVNAVTAGIALIAMMLSVWLYMQRNDARGERDAVTKKYGETLEERARIERVLNAVYGQPWHTTTHATIVDAIAALRVQPLADVAPRKRKRRTLTNAHTRADIAEMADEAHDSDALLGSVFRNGETFGLAALVTIDSSGNASVLEKFPVAIPTTEADEPRVHLESHSAVYSVHADPSQPIADVIAARIDDINNAGAYALLDIGINHALADESATRVEEARNLAGTEQEQ